MLIGSLNTTSGLQFWTRKTNLFFVQLGSFIAASIAHLGYKPNWTHAYHDKLIPKPSMPILNFSNLSLKILQDQAHKFDNAVSNPSSHPTRAKHSQSASDGMAARSGSGCFGPSSADPIPTSSVPTVDQPSEPTALSTPTIKFEHTCSNMPRPPTAKINSTDVNHLAEDSDISAPSRNDKEDRHWWSRLWNRDREGKTKSEKADINNV